MTRAEAGADAAGGGRGRARIALSGPRGSFSESAARQLVPEMLHLVPCRDFDAALAAVDTGAADAAVLPRENTLIGTITSALDAVLDRSMRIVAETVLRVEHHLIGPPGASVAQIRQVHSHPAALAQCRTFLGQHPEWGVVHEPDTATAVRRVVDAGDPAGAAIASRDAAALYDGAILLSHLEDSPRNFTRFALLVRGETPWPAAVDTMTLEVEPRHEAGGLVGLLEVFAAHGLSILTIETRPDRERPWRLRFVVDVFAAGGGVAWDAVEAEIAARAQRLAVIGRYAAAPVRIPPDARQPQPA